MLTRLFHEFAEVAVDPARLGTAIAVLGDQPEQPATRGKLLEALSIAAGISLVRSEKPQFADIAADTPLGEWIAAWVGRGWISANPKQHFNADQPMPFSEFKRHAFHACYGLLMPGVVRPIDFRPVLASDTFNRVDGPLDKLESGHRIIGSGGWIIEGGTLRNQKTGTTSYLLVEINEQDAELSMDLFLEQSSETAAAGLVIDASDTGNMQRFLLDTDGPNVRVRIDRLRDGRREDEWITEMPTIRRGFSLRLIAEGDRLRYLVNDQIVHERAPEIAARAHLERAY